MVFLTVSVLSAVRLFWLVRSLWRTEFRRAGLTVQKGCGASVCLDPFSSHFLTLSLRGGKWLPRQLRWLTITERTKESTELPPGYFLQGRLIYRAFSHFSLHPGKNFFFFFYKKQTELIAENQRQEVWAQLLSLGQARNSWSEQKHSKCFLSFKATSGERGGYCNGKFHSERKKGLIINQNRGIQLSFCNFLTTL